MSTSLLTTKVTFVNGDIANRSGGASAGASSSVSRPPKSPETTRRSPILKQQTSVEKMSGPRGNLSELDMLLQDLENKQRSPSPARSSSGAGSLIYATSTKMNAGNGPVAKSVQISEVSFYHERLWCIDYRCDIRRFWLSAHDCQVPTPSSQNLDLEQQIRIFETD